MNLSENDAVEMMRSSSNAEVAGESIKRAVEDLIQLINGDELDEANNPGDVLKIAGGPEHLAQQFHILCSIVQHDTALLDIISDILENMSRATDLLLGDPEDRKEFIELYRDSPDCPL